MAQSSIFWATSGTGDGGTEYTQAQVVAWLRRTFISDAATEGVHPGYANKLAVSGSASPLAIATGAAMVYGFPYENDSAASLVVPTPSSGTTGHRVVLRANWSAQTVRIALVSSADGTADIPAVTQTANTTWEISLATLTITTGGVITLTDARSYLLSNFRNAPARYRQGGSATNHNTAGTTDYTITDNCLWQYGVVEITGDGDTISPTTTITYPTAFATGTVPWVSVTNIVNSGYPVNTSYDFMATMVPKTGSETTQANIIVTYRNNHTETLYVHWEARGKAP